MDNFDPSALIGAAANIDAASYLINAVSEDFMTKYDPNDSKDTFAISWEWARYRAMVWALTQLIHSVELDFQKAKIYPYNEPVSAPPEKNSIHNEATITLPLGGVSK